MLNIKKTRRSNGYYFALQLILLPLLSMDAWAIMEPSVFTETSQTIRVDIEGATPIPLFINGGIPIYSVVSAETQSYALALSTQPAVGENNPPSATGHYASADISLAVSDQGGSLVTFQSAAKTAAQSARYEPLFARSFVYGKQSSVHRIQSNGFSALNLDWQYQKYQSVNTSGVSYSQIADTFRVTTQPQDNTLLSKTFQIGFNTSIENGAYSANFAGPASLQTMINTAFGAGFGININDSNNVVEHIVSIEHIHSEYSIEAPARATNRIEEKVGYIAEQGKDMMFWDPDAKTLSFNPFPIMVMNEGDSDSIGDKYKDDPLVGGYLKVGDLTYQGHDGGIDYFGGGDIELIDRYGKRLFRASLPTLAFESLDEFNLFAPIVNILEANAYESLWLQDYLNRGGIDSLLLHELFIGFDDGALADFSWDNAFSAPATALLSYTGIPSSIPEPAIWVLLLIGMTAVKVNRVLIRRK